MKTKQMTISLLSSMLLLGSSCSVVAKMDYLSNGVHLLEDKLVQDCQADPTPHGYYGAFLQPCEFSFRRTITEGGADDADACSDQTSEIISKPVPMHWFFNLTEHWTKDDWDELSSDDLPKTAEELMLWPDQCVAYEKRCYGVDDKAVSDTLHSLFPAKIPDTATHVSVDCRGDAVQLSRVVYAAADGLERSMPTIIAWMVTVIALAFVATLWCCYACFRLAHGPSRSRRSYRLVSATPVFKDQDSLELGATGSYQKKVLA
jgi:hypothetical protein